MLRRIGVRLIVLVAITAVIIIGVFAYFNSRSLTNTLLGEVERHANELSETVKYSTRYAMLLNQRDHLHASLDAIGEQPEIGRIRLLNKLGEIIYSSRREEIGQMVDKNAESCYACHSAGKPLERLPLAQRTRVFRVHPDSTRFLGVINPIYNETACSSGDCHAHPKEQLVLGVLDVTLTLAVVDSKIARSAFEVAVFAVSAVLALGIIIGLFVARWIDRPVKELVKATQQVADGNLGYTITENRQDELGMLARSFNNMTRKLSEARMQLFQSDKLASLGRLAAGVAHEINNPLTGVLTYSSFLMKRTQDRPDVQDDLKVIVRETIRSREIVKSLLDFARQSVPKKSVADIHEIIERAIHVVHNQLTVNQIKLHTHFDTNLPRITVDANQMQQVFLNLIVNAIDAIGPQGGTISISTTDLKLSPYGITQIRKATCPKRHSLMDGQVRIGGLPAIRLKVKAGSQEGHGFLDPVYGRHNHQYSIPVEPGTVMQASCPECNLSLVEATVTCPKCAAPIVRFEVSSQGLFETCSRRGCDWQRWDAMESLGRREYVQITVADTGCGIPPDDVQRVFEPFFTTKGQKGTGLGLAVIWGIIDNHDGTIAVQSALQKGTTFTIRIPIDRPR